MLIESLSVKCRKLTKADLIKCKRAHCKSQIIHLTLAASLLRICVCGSQIRSHCLPPLTPLTPPLELIKHGPCLSADKSWCGMKEVII